MRHFLKNLLRSLAVVGGLLIGTSSFGATLTTPVDGATFNFPVTTPITFTWTLSGTDTTNGGIRAIIYRTSDNGRETDCWSGNVSNSNMLTCDAGQNLPVGSYYWRVEKSSGGWVDITGSSNSFTVTNVVAPVPTLSEWAMITVAMLIVGFGIYQQRRRQS